jgi:hypothetical protein
MKRETILLVVLGGSTILSWAVASYEATERLGAELRLKDQLVDLAECRKTRAAAYDATATAGARLVECGTQRESCEVMFKAADHAAVTCHGELFVCRDQLALCQERPR